MPKSEFHYEIEQNFEVLSQRDTNTGTKYTNELNLISYSDAEPVYDIRNWTENSEGQRRMGKGITLNLDEIRQLRDVLNDLEELNEE